MSAKGALLCVPVYYDIPAAENPHMSVDVKIDGLLALREHTDLINLLQMFGLSVRLMPPRKNQWDGVFKANIGWSHGRRALVANFRQPIRRPEKADAYEWFKRLGFDPELGTLRSIPTEPDYIAWEGQGDTLMGGKNLGFFTYGIRTDYAARPYIEDMLEPHEKLMDLRLVNPYFYHGDTCINTFRPLELFIYYPGAFSKDSQRKIGGLPLDLIELSPFLANCFAANSIYLEKVFLLNVPFPASEESRLLSAQGKFLDEKDCRFRELVALDRNGWRRHASLVKKLKSQGVSNPFMARMYGSSVRCGYEWFIHQLWDRGAEIVPAYMSQFEPSGAGARCCVLLLDWLLEAESTLV